MSEKTQSSEAGPETLEALYMRATTYLASRIDEGTADIQPGIAPYHLTVTADVPDLNGRRLRLKYDRPNKEDDPTQIDPELPLAYTDESGKNHWQTPVEIEVYDLYGSRLHDYTLEYAGQPDTTRSVDGQLQPGQDVEDYGNISGPEANEIMGHLEWDLGNRGYQG